MKIRSLFLVLIGSAMIFTGCQNDSDTLESVEATDISTETSSFAESEPQLEDETAKAEEEKTPIRLVDKAVVTELADMNLIYQSQEFDFYDETAILKVHSFASIGSDGQLWLDDGQWWAVTLEMDEGIYLLFHQFVQLGTIDSEAILLDLTEDEEWLVVVRVNTTNGDSIYEYNYDQANQSFYEDWIYRNHKLRNYIAQ